MLLLLAVLFAWGTALERQQQRIADSMVRLHVVGASDSRTDQSIKEKVRDAVLLAAEPYLEEADSQSGAKEILRAHLHELTQAANRTLLTEGCEDQAVVTLQRELFGVRHYDTFSLPGGYYDALRVVVGTGEGKNWWCVVYPQICMASTLDEQQAVAVMGGMEPEDVALIQGATGEYRLKWKTLELFEDLMGWFRSMGQGIPTSR